MNGVSRRALVRMAGTGALGAAGVALWAACGDTQVVTKEVPVERVVVKEVPAEKIVTQQVERVVTREVLNVVRQEVPIEMLVEVKQVVEVPVEKVVEKVVTKEVENVVEKVVEVEAQLPPVTVVFVHDHTSGPRGAAMGWGLDRFAQMVPHINIKFVPQPHTYEESFSIQMVAGTAGELALLSGWFKSRFQASGGFMQIDDVVLHRPSTVRHGGGPGKP